MFFYIPVPFDVLTAPPHAQSCVVINPHVESGRLDTTYATNSVLGGGARPGDSLTFIPLIRAGEPAPR